jgi:glycosyltransferase involved in cell wall biosynthesis
VVPAFNAEQYISDAIRSALRQSHTNIEVLVVDDGSVDNTAEVVADIRDPRLSLITQRNQGQSVAINRGANDARGDFIKLLDADDWLNPSHIESQLRAIGSERFSLVSCRWGYFVDEPVHAAISEEQTNRDYMDPLEWIVDSLTKDEGMMGGWMWLIPRALWDKAGGYDPRLSLNNDFHFSIKLLLASDGVRFADKAVYSYRKGLPGALSSQSGRHAMESAFLTTEMGTRLLLDCEDSTRIRQICADRFQWWLFRFYPEYPELVTRAEQRIAELGGSGLEMQGGAILRGLLPFVGWKAVRRMQTVAYSLGWQAVLQRKAKARLAQLKGTSDGETPKS